MTSNTAASTAAVPQPPGPQLGLGANWAQFSLLVLVNAFVGADGRRRAHRTALAGQRDLRLSQRQPHPVFLVAFGLVKAFSNLAAGHGMTRYGRRPVLLAGWICALPVAPLVLTADTWAQVVIANVFLGLNQGLAWSATVVMKIDLAGPRRRGLALGLNEAAGYGAVALAAFAAGSVAAAHDPRAAFWLTAVIAVTGLLVSLAARETRAHAAAEAAQHPTTAYQPVPSFRATFWRATWQHKPLAAVSLAGLINQLNDALAWGLLPVFLLTQGHQPVLIAAVAATYPAVWAISQPAFGALSDRLGRTPLLVGGFLTQAAP
jgi:MFS family permease